MIHPIKGNTNTRRIPHQQNMGRGHEIDIIPKMTYRWPTGTWRDAQHDQLPGKHKSQPL